MSRATKDEDLASGVKWGKDVPGKDSKGKNVEFGTVRDQAEQRTSFVFRRIKKIKWASPFVL